MKRRSLAAAVRSLHTLPLLAAACMTIITSVHGQFQVPQAEVKLLSPRGFEVSIPALEGISIFAFHGKLNEEFENREAGIWSVDVTKVRNGRLTYRNRDVTLKNGDVIYFWTFIIHNGLGYHQEETQFRVGDHQSEPETVTTGRPQPQPQPTTPPGGGPSSCAPSLTRLRIGEPVPCAGALIFEDNFDSFDEGKWRIEQRFSTQPDYKFNFYINTPDTVAVKNSELSLGVVPMGNDFDPNSVRFGPNCTGRKSSPDCEVPANYRGVFTAPIASGQISTVRSLQFMFGRVEVRARLPYADWLFPQLQLQPADNAYGANDYASGLMRIAFATAGQPLRGGVLLDADGGQPFRSLNQCVRREEAEQWADGFHVYGLEWRPDSIVISIDNMTYCRLHAPIGRTVNGRQPPAAATWEMYGGPMVPFDVPFYVTLGVGVAGFNEFPGEAWSGQDVFSKRIFWEQMQPNVVRGQWPGTNGRLLVDYVRVYAL